MTTTGPAGHADTLRADARTVLSGWSPPDEQQATARRRFLAHLDTAPDAMLRECYPDHLTASTLVVAPDRTRVLLTLHAKARRWFQLGGHCERADATLAGAATREAREESGIADLVVDPAPVQLSEHAVPFCDPRGGVHHLDVRFVAVAPEDAEHVTSTESLDLAWWPVADLPPSDPSASAPGPDPDLLDLVRLGLARVGG